MAQSIHVMSFRERKTCSMLTSKISLHLIFEFCLMELHCAALSLRFPSLCCLTVLMSPVIWEINMRIILNLIGLVVYLPLLFFCLFICLFILN